MQLWINDKEARQLLTILSNAYVIDKNKHAKYLHDNFKEQLGQV